MDFLEYTGLNPDVNIIKEAQGFQNYQKFLSFCTELASSQRRKTKQAPESSVSPLGEHQGKKGKYRGSYEPIIMIEAKVNYLTPVGLRALKETQSLL